MGGLENIKISKMIVSDDQACYKKENKEQK
jgi:hypothetical protein